MQNVVAEKHRFEPPKESTLWPAVVARLLPRYLASKHGVVEVECCGAVRLRAYPAGYFSPGPTPERLLETVERFGEDLPDAVPPRARLKALVDVGEAIP